MDTTLKIKHNYVCLQITGEHIEKVKNLYIPTQFNPEQHAMVYGIVIAAPEKLLYYKKEIDAIKKEFGGTINAPLDRAEEIRELTARSALFDVPVEVKEGDGVIFNYNVFYYAKIEGRMFKRDGNQYIIIPYDQCYVAIRGDEIIPLNGIVLLEPVLEEQHSEHLVLLEKEDTTMARIAHIGHKVNGYLQAYDEQPDDDFFQKGDLVIFRKNRNVYFEVPIHRKLDKKYAKLWRRDLLAKVG